MNVVDNLNCVKVINKPCMREAGYVSLIPRTTLHSDSEHLHHPNSKFLVSGTGKTIWFPAVEIAQNEFQSQITRQIGNILVYETGA
jgi:hypothetical protein